MGLTINYNLDSSNLFRISGLISRDIYSTMEKLSSGWNINNASDGPAALVISERLRTQIASLNQQLDNTSLRIAKYETASSAVSELRTHLTAMRTLAVSASNSGVHDENSLAAIDAEASSLVSTYNNQIDNAEFNNLKLLDGSESSIAEVSSLEGIDLTSETGAAEALEVIDQKIREIDSVQVNIGSIQKYELLTSRSSLEITQQNLIAAESHIRDTDIAEKYSDLVRQSIKLQMTIALMSHSNILGNSVLSLLKS